MNARARPPSVDVSDYSALTNALTVPEPALIATRPTSDVRWPKANAEATMTDLPALIRISLSPPMA